VLGFPSACSMLLLAETGCQLCANRRKARTVTWKFGVRSCADCLQKNMISEVSACNCMRCIQAHLANATCPTQMWAPRCAVHAVQLYHLDPVPTINIQIVMCLHLQTWLIRHYRLPKDLLAAADLPRYASPASPARSKLFCISFWQCLMPCCVLCLLGLPWDTDRACLTTLLKAACEQLIFLTSAVPTAGWTRATTANTTTTIGGSTSRVMSSRC